MNIHQYYAWYADMRGLWESSGNVFRGILTWWVLIPIILTGIGIVPAFILGLLRYNLTKERVRCPNCGRQLETTQ